MANAQWCNEYIISSNDWAVWKLTSMRTEGPAPHWLSHLFDKESPFHAQASANYRHQGFGRYVPGGMGQLWNHPLIAWQWMVLVRDQSSAVPRAIRTWAADNSKFRRDYRDSCPAGGAALYHPESHFCLWSILCVQKAYLVHSDRSTFWWQYNRGSSIFRQCHIQILDTCLTCLGPIPRQREVVECWWVHIVAMDLPKR